MDDVPLTVLTMVFDKITERVEQYEYGPYRVLIPEKWAFLLDERYSSIKSFDDVTIRDRIKRIPTVEKIVIEKWNDAIEVEQLRSR